MKNYVTKDSLINLIDKQWLEQNINNLLQGINLFASFIDIEKHGGQIKEHTLVWDLKQLYYSHLLNTLYRIRKLSISLKCIKCESQDEEANKIYEKYKRIWLHRDALIHNTRENYKKFYLEMKKNNGVISSLKEMINCLNDYLLLINKNNKVYEFKSIIKAEIEENIEKIEQIKMLINLSH